MSSVVEPMEPTRVRLAIDVGFDELESVLAQAVADGREGVCGFRRGRLPFQAVDQRVGGVVMPQAVEAALLRLVTSAAREHAIETLGRTDVEIVDCGRGEPLRLTAVVDVRPEITLRDPSTIVVTVDPVVVTDDDIDEWRQHLRERSTGSGEIDREDARAQLTRIRQAQCLRAVRDQAMAEFTAGGWMPVPEGLVGDEIEARKQWMLAEFDRLGTTLAAYLASEQQSEEQLDASFLETTTQRVRGQLALDALATAEGLTVTDGEVNAMIAGRARRDGVPPERYFREIARIGAIETVTADVRRAKALTVLMERITIEDPDGNTVRVEDLRGDLGDDSGS